MFGRTLVTWLWFPTLQQIILAHAITIRETKNGTTYEVIFHPSRCCSSRHWGYINKSQIYICGSYYQSITLKIAWIEGEKFQTPWRQCYRWQHLSRLSCVKKWRWVSMISWNLWFWMKSRRLERRNIVTANQRKQLILYLDFNLVNLWSHGQW